MAGAVNTGYTFLDTDVITSSKMNNIIDETVMTSYAIIGSTLAVSDGKLRVNTSGITANELATGSVTTTAILDANVTTAKIADSNVTTAKIADLNVTTAKIADSNVTTAKIADANVTASKLDGAQSGDAPIFGVRAWGSFDGSASSPITPFASGNIASVVRTATGNWDVTFTEPMSSSDYTVVANATHRINVSFATNCFVNSLSASKFTINTGDYSSGPYNSTLISFVVMQ